MRNPKRPSPRCLTELGRLKLFKDLQFRKAMSGMLLNRFTLRRLKELQPLKAESSKVASERLREVNELQALKAPRPIATASGSLRRRKAWHSEKAMAPMRSTESGMLSHSKELRPRKAAAPISLLLLGMLNLLTS